MAIVDGIEAEVSHPVPKLMAFTASLLSCFLIDMLSRSLMVRLVGIKAPPWVLSIGVSTLHALVVVSTATYTFLHYDGDIGSGSAEPLVGSLGLIVSTGYFTWDCYSMLVTDYQPLWPLLLHHVTSGVSMGLIAGRVPRAVWFTCILQITEGTVPVNNIVSILEARQDIHSTAYILARWALLIKWLALRIGLVLYFFYPVWRDWAKMTGVMRLLALNGPALLLFNLIALFTAVLKGFPWSGSGVRAKRS
jgi:hypothetical protein